MTNPSHFKTVNPTGKATPKVARSAGVFLFMLAASLFLASCAQAVQASPTPQPTPTLTSAPTAQTIIMITEPWDPWIIAPEGQEPSGIFIEITKEICQQGQFQCQIEFYPWNRCLQRIENGESDVLLMLEKNPEREQYMIFSDPLFDDPNLIYYRVDDLPNFQWNQWEDLKPYLIGLTSGYTYGDEFEKAKVEQSYQFDTAPSDIQTFEKLIAKRFDIAILNKTIAEQYLRAHPELAGKIKAADKPIVNASYYIAFSKKSKYVDLLPTINAIIQRMKDDGTMNNFLYGGQTSGSK